MKNSSSSPLHIVAEGNANTNASVQELGEAFVIPTFDAQPGIPPLTAESFRFLLDGSGAEKLADSGVAPLVAAARGYETFTPKGVKPLASRPGLKLTTAGGRQIKTVAATGDALLMPWHGLTEVAEASVAGREAESRTYQLRPAVPVRNADGGISKYLMPAGTETILGIHPATPASWVRSAPRVLIAEGLLKADSAVTAHLIASGVSEEELLSVHGGNVMAARAKLTALMESVPEDKRVLIISIASCTTWSGKTEWASISLRDREAWIAMDADIASNKMVWTQAKKMKDFFKDKKASSVGVLTLPEVNGDAKAGLDDFFAAGHAWSELEGAVGDLPTAPAMTRRAIEITLPTVDFDEAATYTTRTVNRDGIPELEAVDLAEAAVRIDKVVSTRSPLPGISGSEAITGQVSWQVRSASGVKEIQRKRFAEKSLKLLIGRGASVPEALSGLGTGAAAGAAIKPGTGQDVLAAWTAGTTQAEAIEAIETTGLWVDDNDELGFLTSEGILRADGFGTDLRAAYLGAIPEVQIPFVDPVADAKEITDAWEVVDEWRKVINPAHSGLWEVSVGMMMSVAVGFQPKGAMTLFCKRGSGKTAVLTGMSAFYGPKWVDRPAIVLSASLSVVNRDIDGTNNLILAADDARNDDNPEVSSSTKDIERVRAVVSSIVRMGYEPGSVKRVSAPAIGGGWITPPPLPHAARSAIITGEDLAELGLATSTTQRLLSFQTTDELPLLAGVGQIKGANEKLVSTNAAAKLMGAYLVHHLQGAKAHGGADPRAWLRSVMRAMEIEEIRELETMENRPSLRSAELITPALVGLSSLVNLVAEAYWLQGRNFEAEALEASHAATREAVVEAWKRHQERYGDDADVRSRGLVEALTEAVATGAARWEGQSSKEPNPITIGRCNLAPRDSESKTDIILLPNAAVAALSRMGRKVTKAQLAAAFREIVINDRKSVTIGGHATKGWHIPRKLWDNALGVEQEVAKEATVASKPTVPVYVPKHGEVDPGEDF